MKEYSENEAKLIKYGYKSIIMISDKLIEYCNSANSGNQDCSDEIFKHIASVMKYFTEQVFDVNGDDFIIKYRENIKKRCIPENSGFIDYLSYCCAYGYYTKEIIY